VSNLPSIHPLRGLVCSYGVTTQSFLLMKRTRAERGGKRQVEDANICAWERQPCFSQAVCLPAPAAALRTQKAAAAAQ
jgi:hypothetical protein